MSLILVSLLLRCFTWLPHPASAPLLFRQPRRLGVGLADGRVVHVGGALKGSLL
jgi:hypothetical protein